MTVAISSQMHETAPNGAGINTSPLFNVRGFMLQIIIYEAHLCARAFSSKSLPRAYSAVALELLPSPLGSVR
jgi:hypothetical protein